jgi:hypothetical protein
MAAYQEDEGFDSLDRNNRVGSLACISNLRSQIATGFQIRGVPFEICLNELFRQADSESAFGIRRKALHFVF